MSSAAPDTPTALDGVRVLDLTRYIPGPYCTMLLGDLGADVVKVEEPPFGDPTRAVAPLAGEHGALFAMLNRNKRSIAVDLRQEEGAALVRRLAAEVDVFVESYRPGVLARRGLDAKTLREQNPRLVYCSITGYGASGPLSDRAGHDVNYAARGGLLGTTLDAEGAPSLPGAQLADVSGGLLAALGVLAALHARERTGEGQVVETSLLASVLSLGGVPAVRQLAGGAQRGELSGSHACYGLYRCADGRYLSVGALEPKFWETLCGALGVPEAVSQQWATGERQAALRGTLASAFAQRDREAWLQVFAELEACVEPVLDLDEAWAQPQVVALGMLESPSPGLPPMPANPLRLSATPARTRRGAAAVGADGADVLTQIGLVPAEIERLQETGVVG